MKKAKKALANINIESSILNQSSASITRKSKDPISLFAEICGVDLNTNKKTKNASLKDEICMYITRVKDENENDFQKFWQANCSQLPILATIARKCCIIPSSSVASESAFSIANFIQRKERSSLSSKYLKYSMVLRERIV